MQAIHLPGGRRSRRRRNSCWSGSGRREREEEGGTPGGYAARLPYNDQLLFLLFLYPLFARLLPFWSAEKHIRATYKKTSAAHKQKQHKKMRVEQFRYSRSEDDSCVKEKGSWISRQQQQQPPGSTFTRAVAIIIKVYIQTMVALPRWDALVRLRSLPCFVSFFLCLSVLHSRESGTRYIVSSRKVPRVGRSSCTDDHGKREAQKKGSRRGRSNKAR